MKYFLPLLMVLSADPARAQAPLVTDRPDFTESAVTVPRGTIQAETGFTWERAGGEATLSGPEALLRWGLHDRLELRLMLPDYVRGPAPAGFSDAGLGLKVAFGERAGWDAALLASAALPLGEAPFGGEAWSPEVALAAGRDVGSRASLGAQLTGTWADAGLALGGTLVGGWSLTDQGGLFVEVAASRAPGEAVAVLLHHGYTWQPLPSLQLDVHGALGVGKAAPAGLLGAGLSTRF